MEASYIVDIWTVVNTARGTEHIEMIVMDSNGANTNITAENDGSGRCEGMDNDSEDASQQPQGRDTDSAGNNVNDGKGMDNDSEDAIAGNGDEERCDTDTAGNNVNDGKGMDNDSEDAIAGNGEDEERSSRPPASQKPQGGETDTAGNNVNDGNGPTLRNREAIGRPKRGSRLHTELERGISPNVPKPKRMRGIATPGTIQLVPRAIKTPRGYKEHKSWRNNESLFLFIPLTPEEESAVTAAFEKDHV
ncbi:unnamed protein product [Trifolium pratense]|uniref:Uncharacterized protein n=1 Tax=Trifolium pratense TaxID=57577 RepID=A0ACB0J3P5_TRIPR|nr:unnamed protein product [Trifolium pratense]